MGRWSNRPTEVKIEIRTCDLGRGVFCTKPLAPEELVEFCPYIIVNNEDLSKPVNDYIFSMPDPDMWIRTDRHRDEDEEEAKKRKTPVMLMLGFGSMYNHSDTPNLFWEYFSNNPLTPDVKEQYIIFRANKHIMPNEELTINYGQQYWTARPHLTKIDI